MTTKKIPENGKLVFKGEIFDVYQWQQKQFDGSYKTFEAIYRNPSVQIIAVNKNKKIIILKEEQPHVGKFISIPGGVVDDGENPKDAAVRELKEECGVVCKDLELFKITNFSSKIIWETHYFIAKDCKISEKQKLDPGEKIEIQELSFKEFLEITQDQKFRNIDFSNMIFRIMNDKEKLEKFKEKLFN